MANRTGIYEQHSRDLQRLAETFNDVRDKRQAMNTVDVNGRNMICLACFLSVDLIL